MEKIQICDYLGGRDKKTNKGICKRCSQSVVWNRERLARHKRKACTGELTNEEKEVFSIKKVHLDQSIVILDEVQEQSLPQEMTDSKKERIDVALSHFFFRTGISFRIAESDAFRVLVHELNPQYASVMPGPKKICTELLNQEHSKLRNMLEKLLQTTSNLTLTSDGWSNIRGEHLVNFVIKALGHKPIFYKAINTSGKPQTSETISEDIINVLKEIGVEKFCAVITDNAAVMRKAWKLIETQYPHISANGCSAHVMNLLIKDIMEIPAHKNVLSNAAKIIKFVNNHHFVCAKFEEIKNELGVAHKLSLPVSTRWYSVYNSLNDFASAKYAIIKLVDSYPAIIDISPKENSKEIVKLVKDNTFWDAVNNVAKIIEFPSKVIGKLESDDATLNIVYHYFGEIYKNFEDYKNIQQLVRKRWDFIMTESIGIAYMLSPAYTLNNFYIDDDKLDIMGQIRTMATTRYGIEVGQKVLSELIKFMDKMQNLSESRRATLVDIEAIEYWKLVGSVEFPNLFKVASNICSIPCSSAASERIWSTYRFIHSRLRNRLANEKIEKLIFIYVNCSILDLCDTEDYYSGDIFASFDEINSQF